MRFWDASTAADLQPAALVLTDLQRRAEECGVDIMVVGATARDILIRHVTGAAPERRTADIDIAVAVHSWADVRNLTSAFRPTRNSPHTFEVQATEVDVIPFGGVEDAARTITWPNDHRLDVFGFREAMATAVQVTLPGGLVIAVASLPAQSLLKLFAWRDRHNDNRRDAVDLKSIVSAYGEGRYLDELYDRHEALLERHGFDVRRAAAERIGREARALLRAADVHLVTDLLDAEQTFHALAGHMDRHLDLNLELLAAYRAGFA